MAVELNKRGGRLDKIPGVVRRKRQPLVSVTADDLERLAEAAIAMSGSMTGEEDSDGVDVGLKFREFGESMLAKAIAARKRAG